MLTKTIGSVDRGREKLLGRGPGLDEDGYPDADAPERSHDPETQRRQADAYVDTKLATFEAVLSKTLEAVGRGRQKLLGRVPTDDLGVHMAAQDAAAGQSSRSASDSDFLAGLAEPEPGPAQARIPAQPEPVYDAYGYQQPAAQQQDAYAYQDPYGGYQQQPDPYAAYQQPQQQAQQPSLDETSFFDTSMINLDQLRQYEQGR